MKSLFNVIIVSFVWVACTKGKPEQAPEEWTQWTQDLSKRFQEKFAAPTITHHIYLEKPGEVAFYNQKSGDYPRFQKEICEDCPIRIQRGEGLTVLVNVKGVNDAVLLPTEEPSPVFNHDRIYFSVYPSTEEDKVRVFIHDMNQAKLAVKRQRSFYPYSPEWKLRTRWEWLKQPQTVTIQRSDGSSKRMEKVAEVIGELDGKVVTLSVFNFAGDEKYKESDRAMLLYRDFSNGKTTYGAGRFLVVQFPKKMGEMKNKDNLTIDFNYSYNPPCAVSTGFHCPLPIDTVKLPVEVGEKYQKL